MWNMWKVFESGEGSGCETDAAGDLPLDLKKAVRSGTASSTGREFKKLSAATWDHTHAADRTS